MTEPSPIFLDLRGKTKEELLSLKLQIETEISSIRTQIERAQTEARATGLYASASWWLKAKQALRIKGKQCQQIHFELGRMRKARIRSVEEHFIDVVKERIDTATFKTFMETARRRAF